MKKAIAVHSYKGGTGKTYFISNLAIYYAIEGRNVCLIDFDIGAPSLNYIFENYLEKANQNSKFLNDFLDGSCSIEAILKPVRRDLEPGIKLEGKLVVGLMKSGKDIFEFFETASRKWQMNALKRLLKAKKELLEEKNFDYILFDTSPGIKYWSINAIVCSDLVLLLSTLNKSDISGTNNMVSEIYKSLEKENYTILNMVPESFVNVKELEKKIGLETNLIDFIPCSCDVQKTLGEYLLILKNKSHPYCVKIKEIADKIDELIK